MASSLDAVLSSFKHAYLDVPTHLPRTLRRASLSNLHRLQPLFPRHPAVASLGLSVKLLPWWLCSLVFHSCLSCSVGTVGIRKIMTLSPSSAFLLLGPRRAFLIPLPTGQICLHHTATPSLLASSCLQLAPYLPRPLCWHHYC